MPELDLLQRGEARLVALLILVTVCASAWSTGARVVEARPRRLDINSASAAELELVPGIGPVLARCIIEHRSRSGRSFSVAVLRTAIPGFHDKLFQRARPYLYVEGEQAAGWKPGAQDSKHRVDERGNR